MPCGLVTFHNVAVFAGDACPILLGDEIHERCFTYFFVGGEFAGYAGRRRTGF
jgi:hypothetical protein